MTTRTPDADERWLQPSDEVDPRERLRRASALVVGLLMVAFLGFWFLSNFFGDEDAGADRTSGPSAYFEFGSVAQAREARTAIAAALDVAFDPSATAQQWLAAVDAPEAPGAGLADTVEECGWTDVVIDDLRFLGPTEATMFFGFENTRLAGGDWIRFNGSAELVDGSWMISAATVSDILSVPGFCG